MIQPNVGPIMLPGNGLSDTPPDHKSTSEGCLEKKKVTFQFKV